MKSIKYRIYDPIAKKMIESGATPTMLAAFFKATAVLNTRDGMEYQEFTGLKDKNTKEIWEGDICKWEVPKTLLERQRNDAPKIRLFVCTWRDNGFYLESQHKYPYHESHFWWHVSDDSEIIGNLYENPELLAPK